MNSENNARIRMKTVGLSAAILLAAVSLSPRQAVAQATSTKTDTELLLVDEALACFGEPILISSVLHLVVQDGEVIHGNQINATGVGLISGKRYVFAGSPANLVPVGDGDYLYHLQITGVGPDAANFGITAIGPLNSPPTYIVEVHCL